MRRTKTCILALLISVCAAAGAAEPELPPVFGDHMTRQRQRPAPIWRTPEPGTKITVAFAGQTKQVTAGEDGTWRVLLDPMQASLGPRRLAINDQTIEGVLGGEGCLATQATEMGRQHRNSES